MVPAHGKAITQCEYRNVLRLIHLARTDVSRNPSSENKGTLDELSDCELLLRNAAAECEDEDGVVKLFGMTITFRP